MRYNVDEEIPYSDISIFALRGTTVGSSIIYYSIPKERKTLMLYMYANIDGMDKCFLLYIAFILLVKYEFIFFLYSEFHE
jgi:hypothetical protein